jgi:hypothetical protein
MGVSLDHSERFMAADTLYSRKVDAGPWNNFRSHTKISAARNAQGA